MEQELTPEQRMQINARNAALWEALEPLPRPCGHHYSGGDCDVDCEGPW